MVPHGATDAKRPTVTLPKQGKIIGITIPPPASAGSSSSFCPSSADQVHPGSPVEAFLGIPYAVPPTGDRRFRPAAPLPPCHATPPPPPAGGSSSTAGVVLDASRYGPSAPGKQLLAGGPPLVYDEDCLTANVFRPARVVDETSETNEAPVLNDGKTATPTLLPVAVYIHGGAFNRGTASMHNTASMVGAARRPFVAVSFNYRIGALGFLPSGLSAREGVLNLGLRDQIVLFEWVRDNIRAFGGDPGQVTLIGLSAGAHSVCLVVYRPF